MQVTLERSENVAEHIKSFWFRPDKVIDYTAGQFTQLCLPFDQADLRDKKHWFTLSSSPTEELISITTKFIPGVRSVFKHTLEKLKPGTNLTIAEPMGDFVLPKDPSIPLFFVAAGIGITPYRSMIKWLIDIQEKRNIHLIYGVSKPQELAFLDIFQAYPLQLTPVITSDNRSGLSRPLTAERIMQLMKPDSGTLVYISGPEPLVERLANGLEQLGMPSHRLVTDYFSGYPAS